MTDNDVTNMWESANPFPADSSPATPQPTQDKKVLFDEIVSNRRKVTPQTRTATAVRQPRTGWLRVAAVVAVAGLAGGAVYAGAAGGFDEPTSGVTAGRENPTRTGPVPTGSADASADGVSGVIELTTVVETGQTEITTQRRVRDGNNFSWTGNNLTQQLWKNGDVVELATVDGVSYMLFEDGHAVGFPYEGVEELVIWRAASRADDVVAGLVEQPNYKEAPLVGGQVKHSATIMSDDRLLGVPLGDWPVLGTLNWSLDDQVGTIEVVVSDGMIETLKISVVADYGDGDGPQFLGSSTVKFSEIGDPQTIQPPSDAEVFDEPPFELVDQQAEEARQKERDQQTEDTIQDPDPAPSSDSSPTQDSQP